MAKKILKPQRRFSGLRGFMSKIEKKLVKSSVKMLKIVMLKNILLHLETIQKPIVKPKRRFLGSWGWRNLKNDENFQKTWKKLQIKFKK